MSALKAGSYGHTPQFPVTQATKERYKNKGTYIVLVPPHFDSPVFHSFEAVTPRPENEVVESEGFDHIIP